MKISAESFFMSHPDPMWIYDLETLHFLAVNDSAISKYGYSREEFLAMTIADIRPEEDIAALKTNVAAVTEGRGESGVWRHRLKSGQIIHVDITGHTLTHEGRRAELIAARDVSRLVIAEQVAQEALAREETASLELERTKRLLEIAGQSAKFGAWRYDVRDARLEWSPQTALLHDEPEDFSPSVEEVFGSYAPEHRDRIATLFQSCLESGEPFDEILEITSAKGRRFWARSTGEPEHDELGKIVAVQGSFQDISELVAAQKKANELGSRLAETLENISDAFMLLDHDWCFLFVNDHAARLAGSRPEDLIGKTFYEWHPDAMKSPFQIQYERALREQSVVRFTEFSSILGKWLEVDAHPTPQGLAVYFRDVTETRARDEQLRLLESAAARLNDILLITEAEPIDSPDGPKIVYVNDAFERRTGYSRAEVIGQTPRILQGPRTQRDELDRIRHALEKWRPVRSELINYTKSGEEFWLELEIVPLADSTGWFTHWVAIERDVTERKHTEEEIALNQERFRLVSEATNDVIWDWDLTTDRQWWNDNMLSIFGYDPAKIEHGPDAWQSRIHPDDQSRVLRSINAAISGQGEVWSEDYRYIHAKGHTVLIKDRGFVIRDNNGKAIRMVGSMTDVTEQRELEERLRQAQKMEAVGQLTGGVAHDFNNLLTVVLGNAEAMSEELEDQPRLRTMAEMTANAAARGAELTSRLLAFSRKQTLEPQVLDVSQLIQGMDGLLRRTIPENIEIEIVRSGGLWKTEIDPSQLESAVLNLALNARDAMPSGGALTIEMANAALDDEYVANELDVAAGQYVLLVVTDTGQGIPADMVGRIFEPFFTTKDTGKGTGLGLSMVYGFVKQSGGHIRVYSEFGEGTSFKLYFPRSRANEQRQRSDGMNRKIVGGGETILVVEDDTLVREHVVAQLKGLGYRILEASAGTEAIEILQEVPEIDLLFTDVVIPGGMGGRAVADIARQLRPAIKVLFTSGYTENSIVHNGKLDPGVDLLSKPYRRDQLAQKLRKVLDRG